MFSGCFGQGQHLSILSFLKHIFHHIIYMLNIYYLNISVVFVVYEQETESSSWADQIISLRLQLLIGNFDVTATRVISQAIILYIELRK